MLNQEDGFCSLIAWAHTSLLSLAGMSTSLRIWVFPGMKETIWRTGVWTQHKDQRRKHSKRVVYGELSVLDNLIHIV